MNENYFEMASKVGVNGEVWFEVNFKLWFYGKFGYIIRSYDSSAIHFSAILCKSLIHLHMYFGALLFKSVQFLSRS